MPLRLTIEKEYQGEFWTNVYYLDLASFTDAIPAANAIWQAEQDITINTVAFTRYRLDDNVPNTDNYATVILNALGQVDMAGSQAMPLFAVLRVDLTVTNKRPSRKYLRGVLVENNVDGPFNLSAGAITSWTNLYASVLAGIAGLCDVNGNEITGAVVHPRVGMRQLRRGSKKKLIA